MKVTPIRSFRSSEGTVQLDATDMAILSILQDNGRITNSRLALDVDLSESACFNRVRRLEQAKVIEGYRAVISQRALGSFITVLADVTLESHKHHEHSRFERIVMEIPEIVECTATSGQFDYRLKVVAVDMDDYMRLMDDLSERHDRIGQFFSNVVMKTVKHRPNFIRGADDNEKAEL
ncbi:Lrp/AsnC family transcriptional regulator [Tsuneonella suprasediminis]|uniref:Lrp/AsnC family transcriptional regulator n=1 Tax=Tsuneonella suprasediminis TaxID=2306996 RepID=UPI002F93973D